MPRGDKDKYIDKRKRRAELIEESYEERVVPRDKAERRAWATVNKESGGGSQSGSGRGKPDTHASFSRGGRAHTSGSPEQRSAAAQGLGCAPQARQRLMPPSEAVVLQAGQARIAATRAGTPDRPALLLLHGWPHSRALYDGVVEELGATFLVLAMDLPAIGGSRGTAPSAGKTDLADVILTAAENIGAHDITIAGLDVGGMIAFAAARDHGERVSRAIVMNTVIPGLPPWDTLLADPGIWHFAFHAVDDLPEILVRGRERSYFDYFHDALASDPSKISASLRKIFAKAYTRPEALSAGFDWYRAMSRDAEHNARPKNISTPLLYVRGDADGRSIDVYRDGLRGAGVANLDTRVVAGAGELLPIETPAVFIDIVTGFAAPAPAGG